MRIVNSQVVTKPHFGFPRVEDDRLEDKTKSAINNLWDATRKYLIWDPCNYTANIEQVSHVYVSYCDALNNLSL